jgi:putative flippase GtrA
MGDIHPSPVPGKVSALLKRTRSFLRNLFLDPESFTQICKFCGVGVLNTLVGYGAFFLLVNYLFYLLALLAAHIIGVIHSFLWNKYWVFRSREISFREFMKFNVIYAVVFGVNAIALFLCVGTLRADPRLAQLLLLPIITAVSFSGQKLWTFQGGAGKN